MYLRLKSKQAVILFFLLVISPMVLMVASKNVCAEDLELIKPGKLIVAFNGDMPGTGFQDGKLIGLDGELMQWVADELGLEVEPALMEWSAEIASVKSRRVDIMHGMMGWNSKRAKILLMTDPIYYQKSNITQKKGQNWSKLKDLENKRVATITGFGWIDEIKSIPGVKLNLYDTTDAAIRDLLAGRVEALFADPPLVKYALTRNPQWPIHAVPVSEKDIPDYPLLTGTFHTVFGLSQDAPNLHKAVNAKVAEIWKSCLNRKVAEKYGLGEESWFLPGKDTRRGVDRPSDWEPPISPNNCK